MEFILSPGLYYHSWYGSSEKSSAAERREQEGKAKFDAVRYKVEHAIVNNKVRLVELGCKPESDSLFRHLPGVSVDQILDYVRSPSTQKQPPAPAAEAANAGRATTQVKKAKSLKAPPPTNTNEINHKATVDAMMTMSLYVPGKKIVIPLLNPDCHLTAPCWRDFSKAVRQHEGWDVKRVQATLNEKKKFRKTRKGKVYFVNAIYTVPGQGEKNTTNQNKKRKATKAKTSGKSKPAAKKVKTEEE